MVRPTEPAPVARQSMSPTETRLANAPPSPNQPSRCSVSSSARGKKHNGPLSLSVGKIPRLVRVTTTTTTTSRSIFRIHRRVRHLEDEKRREEETTTTEMTIERRRDVCAHESDSGRVRTGSPISTPSVHSATQPRVRSIYAARLMHSNDIHSWRGDASAFDKLTPRIEWLSVVFVPADRAPRSSLPPRLRLPTRN